LVCVLFSCWIQDDSLIGVFVFQPPVCCAREVFASNGFPWTGLSTQEMIECFASHVAMT